MKRCTLVTCPEPTHDHRLFCSRKCAAVYNAHSLKARKPKPNHKSGKKIITQGSPYAFGEGNP